MTLYCGIDLHSNNSVVAVLDEQDHTVFEKRLDNDLATIIEALAVYQPELANCVVESTYNWYWLVDGLMDAGFPVRLAHTSALPEYSGLKYSNDFSDARQLAHLLRLGLLPTGYIYPKEERALRDLLRRRLLLVRQRSLHHVSLQSLIARHSGQRLNTLQIKQLTKGQLADYLQGHALLGGEITHQARCWLEAAVRKIEQELQRHIKPREDYQLLQSMPGVGSVLGTTIALETGTIERFASPGCHARSMQILESIVDSPYIFHLEDDQELFVASDYITRCIRGLSAGTSIGQCLLNYNYAESQDDHVIEGGMPFRHKGHAYVAHLYDPANELNHGLSNCHWPHFSFRPGLVRREVWDLGFRDVPFFEREFAGRYTASGWRTIFLPGIYHNHIGRHVGDEGENAYSLNRKKQFS